MVMWTNLGFVDYSWLCGPLSAVWTALGCVDYSQLLGLLLAVWTIFGCMDCSRLSVDYCFFVRTTKFGYFCQQLVQVFTTFLRPFFNE